MHTQKRYIYGFGGISLELAEIMTAKGENISGFIVDSEYLPESIKHNPTNIPVISFDDCVNQSGISVTIALGEPSHREKLSLKLEASGIDESVLNIGKYISSYSSVGKGTIFHIDSILSSGCNIGKSCLINKNALIGHDTAIGNYSVISPYANIGAHVLIGNKCFIGMGSCIKGNIKIGDNVIIGMGAVVTKDIESESVAFGDPAAVMRRNDTHRVFR